ncbi:MAG: hypothetical protein KHY83_02365 [Coriobacteriia bacterium]|nr:hypothetical protein [Coriobacteriia bacterium]MBS5477495.1 hypothetical protein [Coriobacteriia bacterium]
MAASMLGDALRKTFLAGVGIVSIVGEKGGEVMSGLVERGEQAVSAGRDLNKELAHTVGDAAADARESLLKTRIELMTPEERAKFVEAVQRVATQVDEEQEARAAAKAQQAGAGITPTWTEPSTCETPDVPAADASGENR